MAAEGRGSPTSLKTSKIWRFACVGLCWSNITSPNEREWTWKVNHALFCTLHNLVLLGFFKIHVGFFFKSMFTGPGATRWHLAVLLNTPNIQRWRDCIQNAHGEPMEPSGLHCRYPKSTRSLHQRCDKGNFNGLMTAEREILVSRNGFGSWVYWNSCSDGELGFLTVCTESSFR